jgi:hypothetical protein
LLPQQNAREVLSTTQLENVPAPKTVELKTPTETGRAAFVIVPRRCPELLSPQQ